MSTLADPDPDAFNSRSPGATGGVRVGTILPTSRHRRPQLFIRQHPVPATPLLATERPVGALGELLPLPPISAINEIMKFSQLSECLLPSYPSPLISPFPRGLPQPVHTNLSVMANTSQQTSIDKISRIIIVSEHQFLCQNVHYHYFFPTHISTHSSSEVNLCHNYSNETQKSSPLARFPAHPHTPSHTHSHTHVHTLSLIGSILTAYNCRCVITVSVAGLWTQQTWPSEIVQLILQQVQVQPTLGN